MILLKHRFGNSEQSAIKDTINAPISRRWPDSARVLTTGVPGTEGLMLLPDFCVGNDSLELLRAMPFPFVAAALFLLP